MRDRKRTFELPTFASRIGFRELLSPPTGPLDPAEKWELPYCDSDGGSYYRSVHDAFPHTPRRTEDIPGGALESLRKFCGVEGLYQVFIVPWAVRPVGWKDQKVISPKSILALGSRAVGLWTEKPDPGVKVVIDLEKLSAVEEVTILLYGRLSFRCFGDHLTIRYNTLARAELEPALLELRRRLAGSPGPIPRGNGEGENLPFKWKHILGSAHVRLREGAPAAFRFAYAPGKSRHDIQRAQLLVLNAHELVYLRDPVEASHRYGKDSLILPRSRIRAVRVGEKSLELSSNGVHFSLPMVPDLCQAAARWLL